MDGVVGGHVEARAEGRREEPEPSHLAVAAVENRAGPEQERAELGHPHRGVREQHRAGEPDEKAQRRDDVRRDGRSHQSSRQRDGQHPIEAGEIAVARPSERAEEPALRDSRAGHATGVVPALRRHLDARRSGVQELQMRKYL